MRSLKVSYITFIKIKKKLLEFVMYLNVVSPSAGFY